MKPYITVKEASMLLNVHIQTIYRMIREGRLRVFPRRPRQVCRIETASIKDVPLHDL